MSRRCLQPLGTLVNAGHRLDLVADLLVARKVAGPVAILDAKLPGGLALGGEVLGLGAMIHHLGGQKSDLAPDAFVGHEEKVRRFLPIKAARGKGGRMTTRSFDPGSMPDQDRESVKITLYYYSRDDLRSPNAISRFFAYLCVKE